MAGTYLIGVDIGTTGAKGIIFDRDGNIVSSGYYEYTCAYPKPNWVEQDVDLIVGRSLDATAKAVSDSGINPGDVEAISFSAQRCCTIFIDDHDTLIRPMISWQDNRAVEEMEFIRQRISPENFYRITSMPLNTTWMVSKILWLKTKEPDNWKKLAKIVQLQDYALKTWGVDGYLEDMSDTGFTGLWDPFGMEWSDELLDLLGIQKGYFPEVVASGTKAGTLSKEAAGDRALVFASIGPSGEFLAPLGEPFEDRLVGGDHTDEHRYSEHDAESGENRAKEMTAHIGPADEAKEDHRCSSPTMQPSRSVSLREQLSATVGSWVTMRTVAPSRTWRSRTLSGCGEPRPGGTASATCTSGRWARRARRGC